LNLFFVQYGFLYIDLEVKEGQMCW